MTLYWEPMSVPDVVANYTKRIGQYAVTEERIARQVSEPYASERRAARNAYLSAYEWAESYLSGRHAVPADTDDPTQKIATLTAIVLRLDLCGDCLTSHDLGAACDPATTVFSR